MTMLLYVVCGLVAGFISGLFGLGGGAILVPMLTGLLALEIHKAVGTSLVVIVPTALVASLSYIRQGLVDVKVALLLALLTILGALVGSVLSPHLSGRLLRQLFAVVLLAISLRMFFQK